MGLFDFLNRQPDPGPNEVDGPTVEYLLAHYALRQFALAEPLRFLYGMSTPDSTKLLDSVIQEVAETVGKPPSLPASEIQIHRTRVSNFPCVVLQFPEPKEVAEALMVALVVTVSELEMEQAELGEQIRPAGRYFTLEKGLSLSGELRPVIAEWTSTGEHSNYGSGPPPILEQFVRAIEGLMN